MRLEKIKDSQTKVKIVKEVLADLSEWFGLSESTESYVNESKDLPLIVARDHFEIMGFITLKETSDDVCEIHCMGIKKEYHRKGVGHSLFEAFEKLAKEQYEYIQVKTVE